MRERPLSPHLFIYRFMHTMALSILHRATGVWMAIGFVALVYWLMSAAAGEGQYTRATAVLGSGLFRVVLFSWVAAFCYHLANGIRHLAWDAGFGLEKLQARRSAWWVGVVAILGALLASYFLFCPQAAAL